MVVRSYGAFPFFPFLNGACTPAELGSIGTVTKSSVCAQGQYSVVDADGTRRIVDYTADALHGFNAVVRREGTPHSLPIVRAVARTLVPAPPPAVVQVAPTPASVVRAAPFVQ